MYVKDCFVCHTWEVEEGRKDNAMDVLREERCSEHVVLERSEVVNLQERPHHRMHSEFSRFEKER